MRNRISLVTALAIGATIVAGSAAIAANVGVLTSADDDSIGNLSAETPVVTPPAEPTDVQVVDVYLEDPVVTTDVASSSSTPETTPTTAPEAITQEFTVESAGTLAIEQRDSGLFVARVDASDGWLWKTEQTSASEVRVTFASVDTIYEFVAVVGDDGEIDADVEQPIVNVVQVPGRTPAPSSGGGAPSATVPSTDSGTTGAVPPTSYDDDDDEEYEDHDDEYEDHDDDDDDHDEYEGGEDDD
jgi:hypothetical protein